MTAIQKFPFKTTLLWLLFFSIAMGYMESAVVIYLRKIYYPGGFQFPLVPLEATIGLVEVGREAATIIMLVGIGFLAAQKASLRFAYFLFCFAIWDLVYYFFLWVFLGWPQSLLTWDILFLIPVPWVGPVWAPCLIALTMLLLSLGIIYFQQMRINTRIIGKEWFFLVTGSLVVILSFMWDYLHYTSGDSNSAQNLLLTDNEHMLLELESYIPSDFNWELFITGEVVLLTGIILFFNRLRKFIVLPLGTEAKIKRLKLILNGLT